MNMKFAALLLASCVVVGVRAEQAVKKNHVKTVEPLVTVVHGNAASAVRLQLGDDTYQVDLKSLEKVERPSIDEQLRKRWSLYPNAYLFCARNVKDKSDITIALRRQFSGDPGLDFRPLGNVFEGDLASMPTKRQCMLVGSGVEALYDVMKALQRADVDTTGKQQQQLPAKFAKLAKEYGKKIIVQTA